MAKPINPAAGHSSGSMRGTLRWLRLALVAAFVVPALLFTGAAWFDHDQILDRETVDARSTVGILREHMLKVLDTTDQLIHEADQRVQGMDWDAIRANRGSLAVEFRAMIANRPQIAAMGLTDASGVEWVTSTIVGPPPPLGRDMSQREYWRYQRDDDLGTMVNHDYIGALSHDEMFAISRRRTSKDSAFDGTIHIAIDVSYLVDFWQKAMAGHRGAGIALVHTDGTVLAHSVSGTQSPHLRLLNTLLVPALPLDPDAGLYTATATFDGVRSIYASATIGRHPLVLIYRRSLAASLVAWRQGLIVPGAICAFAAIALAGVMLLAMRQARRLDVARTQQAAAEQAAIEGQRLEILGQLVAGIAHDFGNVVHVVEVGATMIEEKAADEPTRRVAQWIGEAAKQGRWLTRRMLDFARESETAEVGGVPVVQPAEAVSNISRLLSTTLGAGYQVRYVEEPRGLPAFVRGHRSGLEGAIMNLAVNARDSMPKGGDILIRLAPEWVFVHDDDAHDRPSVPPGLTVGLYACISVTDTGDGMPQDVLARASEPFFTTKPRGRGTGLGLAGARGFARSAGGDFDIRSTQGVGTTVTLWLPEAAPDQAGNGTADDARASSASGS